MTEELKPCPFPSCGSGDVFLQMDYDDDDEEVYRVQCNTCKAHGPTRWSSLEAARDWNAMHRASGWISVEDRLPEADGAYVVVWSDGDVTSSTFSQGAFRRFVYRHPKYWQPLPELPK